MSATLRKMWATFTRREKSKIKQLLAYNKWRAAPDEDENYDIIINL
ncbi:hypothetical protein MKI84_02225 [Ancylobacter sp. A5.8]|nr:hypothetical protein [Ancylobacter gelatini]MCJ8141725.1 hypothetical protein [Ancylobacter gelatini]